MVVHTFSSQHLEGRGRRISACANVYQINGSFPRALSWCVTLHVTSHMRHCVPRTTEILLKALEGT